MATGGSLPRPDVYVRRQQQAGSANIVVPMLRPWVVAPAYEILDMYQEDGVSINTGALLTTPARIVGSNPLTEPLTALRGKTLMVQVDNGRVGGGVQILTFPENLTRISTMLAFLAEYFSGLRFVAAVNSPLSMETLSKGDTSLIEIKGGTACAALGLVVGQRAAGSSRYRGRRLEVPFGSFPAPRNNGAYLDFDSLSDEIQVAYAQGGLKLFSRTSTVLRTRFRPEIGGFSFGTPPAAAGDWDFDKVVALGIATKVAHPLVAKDDGDGDQRTNRVCSAGYAAFKNMAFYKDAVGLSPVQFGGVHAAVLVLKSIDKGADGNYIRFWAAVGAAAGLVITGQGIATDPYDVKYIFTSDPATTVADAVAALGPNGLAGQTSLPGTTTKLSDVLLVEAVGDTSVAMTPIASTLKVTLSGGYSAALALTAKGSVFGSLGNNVAFASEYGDEVQFVCEDATHGLNPADPRETVLTSVPQRQSVFSKRVGSIVEAGDDGNYLSSWDISGANQYNTDRGVLYWNLTHVGDTWTVSLYKEEAKGLTSKVAEGSGAADGTITLAAVGGSGLTGSVALVAVPADETDPDQTLTLTLLILVARKQYVEGDGAGVLTEWDVNGVTSANSNRGKLYWSLVDGGGSWTVHLYSDVAHQHEVASGTGSADSYIELDGSHGVWGTVFLDAVVAAGDDDAGNIITMIPFLLGTAGANLSYEAIDEAPGVDPITVTVTVPGILIHEHVRTLTIAQVKSAIEAHSLANSLVEAVIYNDSQPSTATTANVATAFSGGADGTTVAVAASTIQATTLNNPVTAASSGDATQVPMPSVSEGLLVGGWDPVNFKESTEIALRGTGLYAHGLCRGSVALVADSGQQDLSTLVGKILRLRALGEEEQVITFVNADVSGNTQAEKAASVVAKINSFFPAAVASLIGPTGVTNGYYLQLTSKYVSEYKGTEGRTGSDSTIEVVGGDAIPVLLGTAVSYTGIYSGVPLDAKEGDTLVDGTTELDIVGFEDYAVSGITFPNAVLVLSGTVSLAAQFSNWYIQANYIDATDVARPLPDLTTDELTDSLILKPGVVRGLDGVPNDTAQCLMYIHYKALRTDLTRGLTITSEDDLANVSPLIPDNPLGWYLLLMFLTSGRIEINGLGVDGRSDDEPAGTFAAYVRAAQNFLAMDGYKAYAIALGTPKIEVIDYYKQMGVTRSSDTYKAPTIILACPELPERAASLAAASGSASLADAEVGDTVTFDLNSVNILAALQDIGITGADLLDPEVFFEQGIYLDITSDNKHYLVKQVAGQSVTVHVDGTWWTTHEGNEDAFFAEEKIASMQVDGEPASLLVRGEPISSPTAIAEAMQDLAARYADTTRVRIVGPFDVDYTVNGIDTRVQGASLAAQAAVQVCDRNPSIPLSMETIPQVKNVHYPEGFSDYHMGIAAAGGYSLAILDGLTPKWRNFLTTKMSTIEESESSMQVPDDLFELIMRRTLRSYVGPFGIDDAYVKRVAMLANSVCGFAEDKGIYRTCKLSGVRQETRGVDEGGDGTGEPRNVFVDVKRGRKYPANFITVRI